MYRIDFLLFAPADATGSSGSYTVDKDIIDMGKDSAHEYKEELRYP